MRYLDEPIGEQQIAPAPTGVRYLDEPEPQAYSPLFIPRGPLFGGEEADLEKATQWRDAMRQPQPVERGLLHRAGRAPIAEWGIGKTVDRFVDTLLAGGDEDVAVEEYKAAMQKLAPVQPAEGLIEKAVIGAPQIAGQWGSAIMQQLEYVGAGAAAGAGIGAIGGGVGAVPGAIAGAGAGVAGAVTRRAYRRAFAQMYVENRDRGIAHGPALISAATAAIPHAAIEFAQFGLIAAPLKAGVVGIARKASGRMLRSTAGVLLKAGGRHALTVGAEAGEEFLQKEVELLQNDFADYLGGRGVKFDKAKFLAYAKEGVTEFVEAVQTFLLVPIGGTGLEVAAGVRGVRAEAAAQNLGEMLALAEAKSASRADVASALGVAETALKDRPDLATRKQREAAIGESKAERGRVQGEIAGLADQLEAEGDAVLAEAEAQDAEEAGKAVEAPGPETGLREEAGRPLRVRDVAEDRVAAEPGAAEAEVSALPEYGELNRVVTPDKYAQAKAAFTEKTGPTRPGMGLSVDALSDLAVMGMYHFEAGARQFMHWSRKMAEELGEEVRPHLKGIWKRIEPERKKMIGFERGIKQGILKGARGVTALHRELVEEARSLSPADQARAARMIARVRTPGEVKKVHASIARRQDRYAVREALGKLEDAKAAAAEAKLPAQVQAKLDDLTRDIATTKSREATLRGFNSLLKAADQDTVGRIPQVLIENAREGLRLSTKPLARDMAADDIRALAAAVQAVVHEHVSEGQLRGNLRVREYERAVTQMAAEITADRGASFVREAGKVDTPGERGWLGRTFLGEGMMNIQTMVHAVVPKDSLLYEAFIGGARETRNAYTRFQQADKDMFFPALEENSITVKEWRTWSKTLDKKGKPVTIEGPGFFDEDGRRLTSIEMYPKERMVILGLASDPEVRAQLLRNKQKGVTFKERGKGAPPVKITAEGLETLAESADPRELAMLDAIAGHIQVAGAGRINPASMRDIGSEIATKPRYFRSKRDGEFIDQEPSWFMQNARHVMLKNMDFLKERTGSDAPYVVEDIDDLFFNHMRKVNAYAAKVNYVHDMLRILKDPRIRKAIRDGVKHGNEWLDRMEQSIYEFQGIDFVPDTTLEAGMRRAIRKFHSALLGFKPWIAISQPVSYLLASYHMSPKFLALGLDLRKHGETLREMQEWSAVLRDRVEGDAYRILTAGLQEKGLVSAVGKKPTVTGAIKAASMWPIHMMDSLTIGSLWRAAKAEQAAEGHTGDELMQRTAARTEELVDLTQPTWDVMTSAGLVLQGRQNPLIKLGVMFASQKSKCMQMAIGAYHDYRRTGNKARFVQGVLTPTIVNAIILHTVRRGVRWLMGDRDEEDRLGRNLQAVFNFTVGPWLGVGDAASLGFSIARSAAAGNVGPFLETLTGGAYTRPRGTVLASAANALAEAGLHGLTAAFQYSSGVMYDKPTKYAEKWEKKWKLEAMRAAEAAIEVYGLATGMPTAAALQVARPHLPTHKPRKGR